jgi:HlyD family secretion protein
MRTGAWKRESTSARSCCATTPTGDDPGVEFVKRILIIAGGLIVSVAILLALTRRNTEKERYRFVEIERGDIEYKVSSTGKLEATTTVQVGTQISGRVVALYADFNDPVQKGQIIARIDTTLLAQDVRAAEATLARRRAEVNLRTQELDRLRKLSEQDLVAESEAEVAESNLAVAKADLVSAQASLEGAKQNLAYATIRAPIDGVVVERTVDVGQTVAASLSSPQLFRIAEDLSKMRILVSVDESDIGAIREGQPARFTVQAYPVDEFAGMVKQVRLQSVTEENVVNYTVVVDVDNSNLKLLPGMTATVDFVIQEAEDVLKVPNAALRFRPTGEMLAQVRDRRADTARAGAENGGSRRGASGSAAQSGAGERSRAASDSSAALWILDGRGQLRIERVRTGLTDGQSTEVRGTNIQEGMEVIAGVTGSDEEGAKNPFQAQRQQQFGRPRPPGG